MTSRSTVARPALLPLPHSPESMEGIPWYDEEFDVAQSRAHSETIAYLAAQLGRVAAVAGFYPVSDNPVWYWSPGERQQKALYPDYALTANPDWSRLMATELVLALEVVGTVNPTKKYHDPIRADHYPAKEYKDTVVMRACNEAHRVREFVLMTRSRTMRGRWCGIGTTNGGGGIGWCGCRRIGGIGARRFRGWRWRYCRRRPGGWGGRCGCGLRG